MNPFGIPSAIIWETSFPHILRKNLSPTSITVWRLCEHMNMLAGLGDTTNTVVHTNLY